MTRETLIALGLTDEQVEGVMKEHGKTMARTLADLEKSKSEATTAKTELTRYQKGGDLYNDPEELKRLKLFEQETLTKDANAKKTAALEKLYKSANASESATKLLIKGSDLSKIELDEKGEVKGGVDILKQAKADYSDFFGASGGTGAPHATGKEGGSTGFNFNFTGVRAKPETTNK